MPEESTTNFGYLTASRLKTARACQRMHKHRYLDGYVPVEVSEALRFGTLMHRALEAWWLAPVGDRLAAVHDALDALPADPLDVVRAEALMTGYTARWAEQDLEVVAVEQEFCAPLVNPESGAPSRTWGLAGKIDAIVRTPEGKTMIVEHKTTSADIGAGSDYLRMLRVDAQVSIYYLGAAALGHDVDGCIYDVIRKPALRMLSATPPEVRKYTKDGRLYASQRDQDETQLEYRDRLFCAIGTAPNDHFLRAHVVRLEAELDEARFDIWQIGRQLREAELAGRFPRNVDSCVRWGQTCPYFPVCCNEASLDDPSLYRRVENIHPELAERRIA